jgi:hypothetical protein
MPHGNLRYDSQRTVSFHATHRLTNGAAAIRLPRLCKAVLRPSGPADRDRATGMKTYSQEHEDLSVALLASRAARQPLLLVANRHNG